MALPLIMMFLGGIMFVGFISSELFEITKVPDSIILIVIGLALRHWGVIESSMLEPLTGLISSIAIAIILFESGMNINFGELASSFSGAFNLANLSFLLNSLAIGALTFIFMGWDPMTSLMLGFILGGTSAAVVIPIAKKILSQEVAIIVELESTLTNVYNFVFSLSVANLIKNTSISPSYALNSLLSYFSIGVFIGIVAGMIWISFAKKMWRKQFSYMLTLATLFILYGFTEFAGGSGAVAGLVFGLILGNNKEISEVIKTPAIGTGRFLKFSQEMAFLIRTYFFLFLGIILKIPSNPVIWALAISIAISSFALRAFATKILALPLETALLIPRGLSEAVISSIIIGMGLFHSTEIITIVGLVIILTNLFPSFVMIGWKRMGPKTQPNKEANKSKG